MQMLVQALETVRQEVQDGLPLLNALVRAGSRHQLPFTTLAVALLGENPDENPELVGLTLWPLSQVIALIDRAILQAQEAQGVRRVQAPEPAAKFFLPTGETVETIEYGLPGGARALITAAEVEALHAAAFVR